MLAWLTFKSKPVRPVRWTYVGSVRIQPGLLLTGDPVCILGQASSCEPGTGEVGRQMLEGNFHVSQVSLFRMDSRPAFASLPQNRLEGCCPSEHLISLCLSFRLFSTTSKAGNCLPRTPASFHGCEANAEPSSFKLLDSFDSWLPVLNIYPRKGASKNVNRDECSPTRTRTLTSCAVGQESLRPPRCGSGEGKRKKWKGCGPCGVSASLASLQLGNADAYSLIWSEWVLFRGPPCEVRISEMRRGHFFA